MNEREMQIAQAAQRIAFAERITQAAAHIVADLDGETAAHIGATADDLRGLVDRLRNLRTSAATRES